MLAENFARVRQRIRQACERVGRDPACVTLVAVTKGLPVETIREAAACGITDVGENRVQEAIEKQRLLGLRPHSIRWHLIGHLQRNKAKDAVDVFSVIHSVDSLALADELERQAAKRARSLDVFVQVNVSGETTKFGCRPEEASALARHIASYPHLRLKGLMTLAPFGTDPELARPAFRELRLLRDKIQASGLLSMGMSHDFEVAIEEGADVVRIGTAIFGDVRPET